MYEIPNERFYTDAKFRRDKARVKRLITKWVKPLGLDHWQNIRIEYSREPLGSKEGRTTVAECQVAWEYLRATITFDMLQVEDLTDGELEYKVLHELCHLLVAEMAGPKTDRQREERVVTNMAMAFMDVEIMGMETARKNRPTAKRKKN